MAVRKPHIYETGLYFITFTNTLWLPLIETNKAYDLVYHWFDYLKQQNHHVVSYVIMPNHIHLLLAYRQTMLMPGRYVSDTSEQCAWVTTTKFVPVWVYGIEWPQWACGPTACGFTLLPGGGSVSTSSPGTSSAALNITVDHANSGAWNMMDVSPGLETSLLLNINHVDEDADFVVQVDEENDTGWHFLANATVSGTEDLTLNFTPTQAQVKISFILTGHPTAYKTLQVKNIKHWYLTYQQQTENTLVCNSEKDNYRFGFNGKEKDNEWSGIGNHLDYGVRGYDSRTGRWIAKDPLSIKYPFASPYNFALNTPIWAKDPDGRVVIFINGQHTEGDVGHKYWLGFDTKVMNKIGDHNPRYYDGAIGGWQSTTNVSDNNLSASNRYMAGYKQGIADAKSIIDNLKRDKDGNITESVKIIAHSMGGVYAKGFVAALNSCAIDASNNEYLKRDNPMKLNGQHYYPEKSMSGFKIEFEVDFASFQPNKKLNAAVPSVKTIQVSHKYDNVVNGSIPLGGSEETKEEGVDSKDYHLNTTDPKKGHSITTFNDETQYVPSSTSNGQTNSSKTP